MEKIISKLWINHLDKLLSGDLPGYEAQKLMEPPMRNSFSMDSSKARKAATLLALYYEEDRWNFILIERSTHPLDKHKGQISFPGGSIEKGENAANAAIREANEEIGIPASNIRLIGQLSPLFIPVSNFMVQPYVGLIDLDGIKLKKEDAEVEQILHVPLNELIDEQNIAYQDMKMTNGFTLKRVPVFRLANQQVWGATAMMLSEFRQLILA